MPSALASASNGSVRSFSFSKRGADAESSQTSIIKSAVLLGSSVTVVASYALSASVWNVVASSAST